MMNKSMALVGLSTLFLWVGAASAGPADNCVIDFEGLSAGTVVTELSVGQGISGCTTNKTIPVTSQNGFFGSEAAIVFDSDCPPAGGCFTDPDLGTPNQDFGGPGIGAGGMSGSPFANDVALGNLLILAENKIDSNGDDLVDEPDDADVPGRVALNLMNLGPKGAKVNSVTLVDVELDEGENPATVTLLGDGPPSVLALVDTGNNGVFTIAGIALEGVKTIEVDLKGSSALASVLLNADEPGVCWATFGGFHSDSVEEPEGQKVASFGGNVGPPPSGHLNIVKHLTGEHLSVPVVEVESCERDENICADSGDNSPGQPGGKKGFDINVLNFVGAGDLDGEEVEVTGQLVDCGEPSGKNGNDSDQFQVFVNGGLFIEGELEGGNVQLHPPTPNN